MHKDGTAQTAGTALARGSNLDQLEEARKRVQSLENQLKDLTNKREGEIRATERELKMARLDLMNSADDASFGTLVELQFGDKARQHLQKLELQFGFTNVDIRRVVELKIEHRTNIQSIAVLYGQGFTLNEINHLLETRNALIEPKAQVPTLNRLARFARQFKDVECDESLESKVAAVMAATGLPAQRAMWTALECARLFGTLYLEAVCDFLDAENEEREERGALASNIRWNTYDDQRRRESEED